MAHNIATTLHDAKLTLTPYTAINQAVYKPTNPSTPSSYRIGTSVDLPAGSPDLGYAGNDDVDLPIILGTLGDLRESVFGYVPDDDYFISTGVKDSFVFGTPLLMLDVVEYLCKVTYNGEDLRGRFYGLRKWYITSGDDATLTAFISELPTDTDYPFKWTEGTETLLSVTNYPSTLTAAPNNVGYINPDHKYSNGLGESTTATTTYNASTISPTVYFGSDSLAGIWNNVMPMFLYDLDGNYKGYTYAPSTNGNIGYNGLIFASGGERVSMPADILAGIVSYYPTGEFTSSFTPVNAGANDSLLEQTFSDFEITNAWYSGLNFVIPDDSEMEEDMFTNMVGLWELAASEQQNLATALSYAQEQNDPILNSIVGMRIFKTPSVSWAKNSAATRIFTREHSGEYTYVNGQKLTNQFNNYVLGTYTFSPYFNNFMDYPPYTKIFLYLPFVGVINLDANIVMGKTVTVYINIDAYSGDLTYEVRQGGETGGGTPLSTYTSNCSIELPIPSEVNQDYKIGLAIASLAVNTMGSALSGGKTAGFAAATTAASGALDIAGTVLSGGYDDIKTERGNLSGGHGWNNWSTPFVMIVRPIDGADASYLNAKGLPCMKTKTLSACSGFTACIEPQVACNATREEAETLKRQLEEGVII